MDRVVWPPDPDQRVLFLSQSWAEKHSGAAMYELDTVNGRYGAGDRLPKVPMCRNRGGHLSRATLASPGALSHQIILGGCFLVGIPSPAIPLQIPIPDKAYVRRGTAYVRTRTPSIYSVLIPMVN